MPERKPFFSAEYELRNNRVFLSWRNLQELVPPGSGLCLDIGARTGRRRRIIEALGYKWVGFDVVENRNLSLVADAHDLPFANNTFNIVFMYSVIEYLRNPWKALEEAHRVLKEGSPLFGSVAFVDPFDDTYFCFSHWGVERLLKDTGFKLLWLEPGITAFTLIIHHLLGTPNRIPAPKLTRTMIQTFLLLHKKLSGIYFRLRFGKASLEYERYLQFFQKFPLRFAGEIIFVAEKPKD